MKKKYNKWLIINKLFRNNFLRNYTNWLSRLKIVLTYSGKFKQNFLINLSI